MAYLGIDYGSKRVGIAVSDPEGKMAFPVSVIQNDLKLLEEVAKIAREKNVKIIVLGESKDYKGEDNKIMSEIKEFAGQLKEVGYEVAYEPEFMTSVQASRLQGENELIDASAAAILLQSFLDKQSGKTESMILEII